MKIREGTAGRTTKETDISISLALEGQGNIKVKTGIGFFDHMLVLLASHGGFDLNITCKGDLEVDGHHTVEDTGIVLGKALSQALGDKKGINRYGTVFIPMDEALAMVSLDISGRPYLHYETPPLSPAVGGFDTQLVEEFLRALSVHGGLTIHVKVLYGRNTHHMIEAIFKAVGRALKSAVAYGSDKKSIPSSKGVLD